MDMSLDDIIKSNRKTRGGGAQKRGTKRGSGAGNRGGARATMGGRGRPRGSGIYNRRQTAPYKKGNVDGQWSHDMYDTSNTRLPGGKMQQRFSGGGGNGGSGVTKMMISNLDFSVTDADIQELFGEFGPVRSAAVHYDRSGRSLGTAHVIFERRNDAVRAVKQYGGVPLDGRAMKLELATSQLNTNTTSSPPAKSSPTATAGRRRGGGERRGNRRGGGGGRGGGAVSRQKQKTPTAEQLDAELDAYISSAK